ncbi:hypothetical protein Nmel_010089 [Mimus melanotis]
MYFPRLFVHLLFQVFFSTLDTPEEVENFWKGCQEEHGIASNPKRFAVRTLKFLLCQMQYEGVARAVERKHGWDMLLCADIHHYGMGVLAREMSCASLPLCSRITRYLLRLLSTQEPRWDLPALAFLVEILKYQDLSECSGKCVLQILSWHLRSECRERCCLALRALLVLIDDPSMTKKMCSLTESLLDLLRDTNGDIVRLAVMVLSFIVLENTMLIPSPIALQLAEVLLPLFDHVRLCAPSHSHWVLAWTLGALWISRPDNSQVQHVSIIIFQTLLTLLLKKEKKALKTQVQQSLLPLFFHCHDENPDVAEASRETLLCAAKILKRRDLEKLLQKEQLLKFAECLTTGAESPSTCARPCHTCGAHRSPCKRRPSGSWVSPASLPDSPPQLGPNPACCPGSGIRPGALELRLPSGLLLPSRSRALGRQDAARARAEPCWARRACGHRAGSAAGRELCCWPEL